MTMHLNISFSEHEVYVQKLINIQDCLTYTKESKDSTIAFITISGIFAIQFLTAKGKGGALQISLVLIREINFNF